MIRIMEDIPEGVGDLSELISNISEETWCAGWMKDIEFHLWAATHDEAIEDETFVLSTDAYNLHVDDVFQLGLLSERVGGWIVWKNGQGAVLVPLAEWLQLYNEWKRMRVQQ
jgi:hypothetical protein